MHVLYHLAADPALQQALRAEVEGALDKDGWTKNALVNMHKVDSVLRESQRINGINSGGPELPSLPYIPLTLAQSPSCGLLCKT